MKKLALVAIAALALSGASFGSTPTLSSIVKSGAKHTASVTKRVGHGIKVGLQKTGHFLVASDGGPIPTCGGPQKPCGPDDDSKRPIIVRG